ncbi:hypothetical protein ACFO0A_05125 [Novosphingobium tardum]|uniref:Uncharacterized protein n=1 Tax=Novosphingobium tardum TaxID=1538021 RepID=A0ABV8RNN2_9SPHN
MFRVALATWCAAVMGLGSLALAPPVLERIVGVTGIAGLIPAAAPPLGVTARLLFAGLCASAGALAGVLIAHGSQTRVAEARVSTKSENVPLAIADATIEDQCKANWTSDEDDREAVSLAIEEPGPAAAAVTPPRAAPACRPAPKAAAPLPAIATAPLDTLGNVELLERLALAMAARRERLSASADEAAWSSEAWSEPEYEPAPVSPRPGRRKALALPPIDPAEAMLGEDDFTDEDSAEPGWRAVLEGRPAPVDEHEHDGEHDEDLPEDGYSSLLDMTPATLRTEFVRIDAALDGDFEDPVEDGVVIFPGQPAQPSRIAAAPGFHALGDDAASPPADADEALRSALASLQRLSGSR